VDGVEIANLKDLALSFYKYNCCPDCSCDSPAQCSDVYFNYSTQAKTDGEFGAQTSYRYNPAKASFTQQEDVVNVKEPTKQDYAKL
jgi:hypothetical protein